MQMSIFHLSSFHSLTCIHSLSHISSLEVVNLAFERSTPGPFRLADLASTALAGLLFFFGDFSSLTKLSETGKGKWLSTFRRKSRCVVHVELAAVLRRRNGPMRLTVSTLGHILPSDVVVISGRGTRLICSRTCCHRCRDFTVDMTEIGGIGHRSTNRIIVLHVTTVEEDVRRSQLC